MAERERAREKPGPGPAPEPGARDDVRVAASPVRCPFCHDGVDVSAPTWVACAGCLARHHAGCWDEGGRCGACGGAGRLAREDAGAPPPARGAPPSSAPALDRDARALLDAPADGAPPLGPPLSFDEARAALGLDEAALRRLVASGELAARRDGDRMVFPRDEVLARVHAPRREDAPGGLAWRLFVGGPRRVRVFGALPFEVDAPRRALALQRDLAGCADGALDPSSLLPGAPTRWAGGLLTRKQARAVRAVAEAGGGRTTLGAEEDLSLLAGGLLGGLVGGLGGGLGGGLASVAFLLAGGPGAVAWLAVCVLGSWLLARALQRSLGRRRVRALARALGLVAARLHAETAARDPKGA